jgi:hypothetical protein
MMLDCAEAARIERDYVARLEYVLTVSSVDNHPNVTAALAATVLEIIEALRLAPGAAEAKQRLAARLSYNDSEFDYGALRESLNRETLLHVLDLTRLAAGGLNRRTQADEVAAALIGEVNNLLIEEEEKRRSIKKEHAVDHHAAHSPEMRQSRQRTGSRRKFRPSAIFSSGSGRIRAALTAAILLTVTFIFHRSQLLDYLQPEPPALSPACTPQPPVSEEAKAWMAAKSASSEGVLQNFLRRFPDSTYANLARARIQELKQRPAPVAPSSMVTACLTTMN